MAKGTTLGYHGITDCHKAGNVLCDLLGIIDVDFHVSDQLLSILNLSDREKLGHKAAVRSAIYVLPLGGSFREYTN
jgi:hypothetical protein